MFSMIFCVTSIVLYVPHAHAGKFFSLDSVRQGIPSQAIAAKRGYKTLESKSEVVRATSHFKPLNRKLLAPTRPISAPQGKSYTLSHQKGEGEDFFKLAHRGDVHNVFEEVNFGASNDSPSDATTPRSLTHQMILSLFEPEAGSMPKMGHRWPVASNIKQRISSPYGLRQHPFTGKESFHAGLDIAVARGSKVFATADGIVEGVGTHPRLGKYVKVMHEDGFYSLYGHLEDWVAVQESAVEAGDVIGTVGSSGRSTGPHLDYSLRRNGQPVDPLLVLPVPESLQTVELSSLN